MNKTVVPNALADVILVVGVDDNIGLIPVADSGDVAVFDALYELKYEPRVLSTISATDMINIYPFTHTVDYYPPTNKRENLEHKRQEMVKVRGRMMSDFNLGSKTSFHPSRTARSVSVNPMLLARSMSMTLKRPKLGRNDVIPDLPLSDEVINSIPTFCFPDGLKVHERKPENMTHFFVQTDIHGSRSYTTCLTFYRSFTVEKDDQENAYISLDLSEQHSELEEEKLRCYIPHCCVIISKFPYYTTMKECLSSMLSCIEKDPEEMTTFMAEYANLITHTPVPPAGNLAVNFRLYNLNVTLMPSTHPDKPVIDLELHLTFLCFNAEEFLKILSSILAEERIVFLSSNYALLTLIMESVMNLVLPFKWRFTYSTILPSCALGYLESPGTFMYGVHSRHKEEVQQVEGLILVDIDEGTVFIPEEDFEDSHRKQNGCSNMPTVPNIPPEIASVFKTKWT